MFQIGSAKRATARTVGEPRSESGSDEVEWFCIDTAVQRTPEKAGGVTPEWIGSQVWPVCASNLKINTAMWRLTVRLLHLNNYFWAGSYVEHIRDRFAFCALKR